MKSTLEVIAMHGWGRDARTWDDWRDATQPLGWQWQTGERGYGELAPQIPRWPESERGRPRLVLARSLGPHLLPAEVLREAGAVVLMASFAQFVPPGRGARRVRAALAGMASCLEDKDKARTMLRNFLVKVAAPQSAALLRGGPADGPLEDEHRARLREDLGLLQGTRGLPAGFPSGARVLIVEAEEDRIVEPEARALLREDLPDADVITLPGVGHALLGSDVVGRVVEWVEALR